MKRVIVSFSFLQIEESGKLISKPFVISNIKFANPLYAFGKVANFDPGNFATLPNAKMALANFNLLNLLSLNPSLPFCHQRGRGREPVPYISQHISQPLSTNWRRFRVCVNPYAHGLSQKSECFPLEAIEITTCAFHPHDDTVLVTAASIPSNVAWNLTPGHKDGWPTKPEESSWELNVQRVHITLGSRSESPIFVAEGSRASEASEVYAVCNFPLPCGSHPTRIAANSSRLIVNVPAYCEPETRNGSVI